MILHLPVYTEIRVWMDEQLVCKHSYSFLNEVSKTERIVVAEV
jgi:hypothetical protein